MDLKVFTTILSAYRNLLTNQPAINPKEVGKIGHFLSQLFFKKDDSDIQNYESLGRIGRFFYRVFINRDIAHKAFKDYTDKASAHMSSIQEYISLTQKNQKHLSKTLAEIENFNLEELRNLEKSMNDSQVNICFLQGAHAAFINNINKASAITQNFKAYANFHINRASLLASEKIFNNILISLQKAISKRLDIVKERRLLLSSSSVEQKFDTHRFIQNNKASNLGSTWTPSQSSYDDFCDYFEKLYDEYFTQSHAENGNGTSGAGANSTSSAAHTTNHTELQQLANLLGVSRDVGGDEFKRAFRKFALIHHPDKLNNSPQAEQSLAMFKEVNELMDKLVRKQDFPTSALRR